MFKGLDKEGVVEPSKEDILEGLKDALQQVKLNREGKIKLQSARSLLAEL